MNQAQRRIQEHNQLIGGYGFKKIAPDESAEGHFIRLVVLGVGGAIITATSVYGDDLVAMDVTAPFALDGNFSEVANGELADTDIYAYYGTPPG